MVEKKQASVKNICRGKRKGKQNIAKGKNQISRAAQVSHTMEVLMCTPNLSLEEIHYKMMF